MRERPWNGGGFAHRNHGSDRRGVFPVRSISNLTESRQQSKRDREKLLEIFRQQTYRTPESIDFGNKELPAYKHKAEILANVEMYKSIILGGPTGSGKSTQVPQYLYEAGYDKVYVLVPRRVIADGLGDRLREEMSEQLGEDGARDTVGIVHGERSDFSHNNKIVVMTPNTYVRMERDIDMAHGDSKVAIISDEIHEANLFTEIATGVAAMGVHAHENWRLIAASATHNVDDLNPSMSRINGGYVPVVSIEGRPFNVERIERPDVSSMEAYRELYRDHEVAMIFTSGKREIDHIIDQTVEELESAEKGSSKNVVFRKLHAELTEVELAHVNDPVPEGCRLAIVASPAGMSGITIPRATLVITDGTINRQELDSDGIGGLVRHYLSKAEVTQQIGRAGRDMPGGVGVITKPTAVFEDDMKKRGLKVEVEHMPYLPFESRDEHAPPEIYNSNLSRVVLDVAVGDRHFSDINPYLPHGVDKSAIISAEESLSRIGALDDDDRVTQTGIQMSRFPVAPELSRGLVEAERRGKTLQQLFRTAIIASAVEVGGLQDFGAYKEKGWRNLLRSSTKDDFTAQLDIFSEVIKIPEDGDLRRFIAEHDLHAKRIERAEKVAKKILGVLRINPENIVISEATEEEESEINQYLTAGMIDLVYEPVARRQRRSYYNNIHGDSYSTQRYIGSRSIVSPPSGQLIAGFPRWFDKKGRSGEPERHNVVELIMYVDPAIVGRYALENNLLQGYAVESRIEGGRVVEREQKVFGTIDVGSPVTTAAKEFIPESSRHTLVEAVLSKPGEAQMALRSIAEELEHYSKTIPAEELNLYRRASAPSNITKDTIKDLLYEYAKTTRNIAELDDRLAEFIYKKNVSISKYYDDSARIELQERSPSTIVVDGTSVPVRYEAGHPYLTGLTVKQRKSITEPIFLSDGREVLIQVGRIGGGTVRVSGSDL